VNSNGNTSTNNLVPSEFYLSQNYPNPFSEKTIIKFCVAYKTKVTLEVFDSEGKMLKKLLDEEKPAGTYEVTWNARNLPDGKAGLSSGVYFYKLQAGNFISTKKMLMIK
jgi:flagellar hook assembly protein FlgD